MSRPVHLLTGFPKQALAVHLARQILSAEPDAELRLIVPKTHTDRATAFVGGLPRADASRVKCLDGDAWALDFGLSGAEWKALAREVSVIHHAAQFTQVGLDREEALRRNRGSTAEAVELAVSAPRIERLVLWSSASVSGARRGFVLEDELDLSHAARNPVEESLRRSELLVRARRSDLPITIIRPGILAGDSRTGEIDASEGTYLLLSLMLSAPPERPMPMPARPDAPLPFVPIDFVARAGLRIATDPRAIGRTFHVVDPDPLTAQRAFELIARSVGRSLPKSFLPPFLANRLMQLPFIQPGGAEPLPRAFLDQLTQEVVYDDHGTRQLLAGSNIACPAFESYVEVMVRYVREQQFGGSSGTYESRQPAL